jgi:hypothetical protein
MSDRGRAWFARRDGVAGRRIDWVGPAVGDTGQR